jgi:putative transposase
MVSRVRRRIRSKTVRMLLTWSHYRFRQLLQSKVAERPHCRLFVVNEAYTSKTCGACGRLHENLGSKKTFRCPSCGLRLDRDVNGARNILLRFLSHDARSAALWT